MNNQNKLEKIKSMKLLQLWGQMPNPDHQFFSKKGISFHKALRDITYSPEVQSAVLARESAVIGDPWQIVSDSDSNSADFITENLKQIGMEGTFREILQALWFGYTVLDHQMEKINGKWLYTKIHTLPSDWFSFDAQGLLIPSHHTDMSPLNTNIGDLEKEVELIQYRASYINPYGESLLSRVFWSATWIRGNMDLWISYIDRFGDDSIVGRSDTMDDGKKMQFLQAISEFKSSGAIVIEGTDEINLLKSDKTSSSALFKNFYEICIQQISRLILGHSSALDSTAGKLGKDEGLSIVRQDITQDDKALIEKTVNRLISHLCMVNGIKERVLFSFVPEREDENQRIERDQKIVSMGFELSEEYMREAYRFSENDIRKQQLNNVPNFSEDTENRKKGHQGSTFSNAHRVRKSTSPIHGLEYYKTIDLLIENGTSSLKREISLLQKEIFKSLEKAPFWEDGLESVLQTGNNFKLDSDDFALKLLNAQIIGRSQVADKVESLQSASFASQNEVLFSTFVEAREYFESRFNLPATVFHQTSNEMKKYAFTVASIVREDILADVSNKLLQAYDEGLSFNSFKKSILDSSIIEIKELTNKQLELVYTQNMNSAYSYGRYQGLVEAVDIFPNWEYVTIGDGRVRANHKALNGTIRQFDDPFWKSFYPPNGYRCRCVVEVSTEEPTGKGVPIWDKKTVDKAFEDGIYPKNFQLGKALKPDYGFDHNIGEMNGWVKDRIAKNNSIATGTRTSFFTNTNPLRNWDKNKNVISAGTDYSKLGNGLKKAKESLSAHSKGLLDFEGGKQCFFDKKGNMVGSDLNYVLDHISTSEKGKSRKRVFDETKWKSRAKLVDVIKDIIETGDIVEDIERYGKNKKLVLSRKYIKNVRIDGENTPVMIVAEYPKFEKDSIPVLTTIYLVGDLNTRTGILLK